MPPPSPAFTRILNYNINICLILLYSIFKSLKTISILSDWFLAFFNQFQNCKKLTSVWFWGKFPGDFNTCWCNIEDLKISRTWGNWEKKKCHNERETKYRKQSDFALSTLNWKCEAKKPKYKSSVCVSFSLGGTLTNRSLNVKWAKLEVEFVSCTVNKSGRRGLVSLLDNKILWLSLRYFFTLFCDTYPLRQSWLTQSKKVLSLQQKKKNKSVYTLVTQFKYLPSGLKTCSDTKYWVNTSRLEISWL